MSENLDNVENVETEIKQNMLRDRAKKLDEITDEKWKLVNEVNREMYDEFIDANKHLSSKTIKQYKTCLKQFFYYIYENLRDKPFYKVTKRDFMKYLGWMQDRKLSSSAIGLRKSAVSSFCNYIENIVADDMEECEKFRNFTRGMPSLAKTQCYEKIAIDEDDYKLLIKTLEDRKDYLGLAWTATAFNTAARRAEILQFKTEILDYEMEEGKTYVMSHNVRGKGKGADGKVVKYMINKDTLKYMKLWVDNRGYDSEYIFTVRYKGEIKPIGITWANELCSNVLSKILGRRINTHIFKASAVSYLLKKGVDMKVVSKYVAHHEDISTTSSHYDLRDFEEEKNDIFK